MAWRIGNAAIESLQGDITRQSDIDAVVNAANAELHTGGGVAVRRARCIAVGTLCHGAPLLGSATALRRGG